MKNRKKRKIQINEERDLVGRQEKEKGVCTLKLNPC